MSVWVDGLLAESHDVIPIVKQITSLPDGTVGPCFGLREEREPEAPIFYP